MNNNKIDKWIDKVKVASIICLVISLLITVVIWASSYVSIQGNVLQFGKVDIDIGYFEGGNKKYYSKENKSMFDGIEPFASGFIQEEFFIENLGNLDAWYSIYFNNIEGTYGYDLLVSIIDADTGEILLGGSENFIQAAKLIKDDYVDERVGKIKAGETKRLIIRFDKNNFETTGIPDMPTDTLFKFDFCVEAVQSRNNP